MPRILGENRYEKLSACAKAKIEATYGVLTEEVNVRREFFRVMRPE